MRSLLVLLMCIVFTTLHAQPNSLFIKVKKEKYQGPIWIQKNKAFVDINQVAFVNWNAGGTNSISGLVGFKTSYDYKDKYFTWKNNANIRYGINKQESRETRKTDDLFELNSNLGFRNSKGSRWFYSARMNFRTQFTNGYKYPDTDNPISRFMAPGYLFFGGGMEYSKRSDNLSFYFSPVTLKGTFVLDDELANEGAFGVTPAVYDEDGNLLVPGEQFRKEFGILVTNSYEMEVTTNINVKNQLSLYSDYINNFGNTDIDWRVDFDFKVNSFVRATLGSHIRYDDDVKTTKPSEIEGELVEAGAKVQWKQYLGVGFAVDF